MSSPLPGLNAAFESWCARQRQIGRLRRGSSEAVYRAMWQALAAWCTAQRPPIDLVGLQATALAAYLASRSGNAGPDTALTPRYQWRLLSLVRRVQADQAAHRRQRPASGAAELIAADPAVRRANAADADDRPAHLLSEEADRLQALLCELSALPRWQDLRDRCAVALQLGAGLGPGDVRALRLADVVAPIRPQASQPWQLRVPASGSAPAHVALVALWAGDLLQRWLAERQAQRLGGDWLLPSTRSGKPWGKVAQYESARRVLASAGLDANHGGSFKLRHSFALRQLQAGHDPDDVARWLGVVDPSVMLRYQQLLGNGPPPTALPRFSPPV
jgi:integrase